MPKQDDPVNHPAHYTAGGIETIDFIEAKQLDFRLANAVKYISRAGKKHPNIKQDLEKAIWYINRYIEKECNTQSNSQSTELEVTKSWRKQL